MKKILVIEDDRQIRENISEILEFYDYSVTQASNGTEGIEKAVKEKPDLIICDIIMPKADGYRVLEEVRKIPSVSNTPFIFLTAKTERMDVRMGMDTGADDYLLKPFKTAELINAVKSRLERIEKTDDIIESKVEEVRSSLGRLASHELNTPLVGILGFADLIIKNGQNMSKEEIIENVRDIRASGERLYRTIDNVLAYIYIQNFLYTKKEYPIDTTENTDIIIRDTARAIARSFGRENDLDLELEPAKIRCQKLDFRTIVREITDNAFKFSKKGNRVKITGKNSDDSYVLNVTDEGRGMTEDEIKSVDTTGQLSQRKKEEQGIGLGLYNSKMYSEINRGKFTINSALSKGTEIRIEFRILSSLQHL